MTQPTTQKDSHDEPIGSSDRKVNEAGERPTTSSEVAPPSGFRHDLANILHGMLLQVRCAEVRVDKGDPAAIRKHLKQLESGIRQSQDLLGQLKSPEETRATNESTDQRP